MKHSRPPRRVNPKAAKRWAAVRKQALKRDNNTCQNCGNPGNDVDHIQKRSTHPELKYELSNLVTLCRPCHRARHDAEEKLHWSN